jgi:DNA-binding response OmpR family regulator
MPYPARRCRLKILIAEDSSTVRRLIAAHLAADGYEVIEAADGEQALAAVRAERPDLLVLDKIMPKLDGFDVVRELRADPDTRAVPIVMLTERATEQDVVGGLDLGVEEYMPKPFSLPELSARIRRTLQRAARDRWPRLGGRGAGDPSQP